MKYTIGICPRCGKGDPFVHTTDLDNEDERIIVVGNRPRNCPFCKGKMNMNPTVKDLTMEGLLFVAEMVREDSQEDGIEYATDEMMEGMRKAEKYYAPGEKALENREKQRKRARKLNLIP